MKVYTDEMIETLKALYPSNTADDVAKKLGVTTRSIYNKAHELNIKKDVEFIRQLSKTNSLKPNHGGKKSQFKKGQEAWNYGKKQTEYLTAEQIEKTVKTRFPKGNVPANNRPVGSERITKDGYVEVKVGNKFKLKNRMVWEQNFGQIPKGYNVQFKDKTIPDPYIPENLFIISRSDQMKTRNSYIAKYPKEVQLVIQIRGALNRQINRLIKEKKEEI